MRNRHNTEQRILTAARAVIAESGFRDWGVNLLATRSDCDKVLIYRYFTGLEGVLSALAEQLLPPLLPIEKNIPLQQQVRNYYALIAENPFWLSLVRWLGTAQHPAENTLLNAMQERLQQQSKEWHKSSEISASQQCEQILALLHWAWLRQLPDYQLSEWLEPVLPAGNVSTTSAAADLEWEELPPEML
jgi:AcrR family transcriptional regulator